MWTLANIVQGETEKEARDFYRYYVHEKGDWEAAQNMIDTFSLEINARNDSAGAAQSLCRRRSSPAGADFR